MSYSRFSRLSLASVAFSALSAALLVASPLNAQAAALTQRQAAVSHADAPLAPCTSNTCTFRLRVNPGLATGKPFACPAMASAKATITVTNRFTLGQLNDRMTLHATGLPHNTGFDLFLTQNSAFDTGFTTFGSVWYQSDVESDSNGKAVVSVVGIFDKETFLMDTSSSTNPVIHTYNVGFWFDSPQKEAQVCGSATPNATPFNGEQNAGLLAMITSGGPLSTIQ